MQTISVAKPKSLQKARILFLDSSGLLMIQSIRPKEQFEWGEIMGGYLYEWKINKYTFSKSKKKTMEALNITENQYELWLARISF